jgi:hypothetical protein
VPRVRNSPDTYRDCEAALIYHFWEKFGSAPLWNKQYESRLFDYEYNHRQMDQALCKRSGAKYRWAVAAMPSPDFYKNYVRTHSNA